MSQTYEPSNQLTHMEAKKKIDDDLDFLFNPSTDLGPDELPLITKDEWITKARKVFAMIYKAYAESWKSPPEDLEDHDGSNIFDSENMGIEMDEMMVKSDLWELMDTYTTD